MNEQEIEKRLLEYIKTLVPTVEQVARLLRDIEGGEYTW